MTEQETLAATMDRTRRYTKYYLSKLEGKDLHKRFKVGEIETNSAYWIIAHLTGSENWLLLNGTGGSMQRYSWGKLFNLGSVAPDPSVCPPFEEVSSKFNEVHDLAMERILHLTDEELSAPHKVGFKIGGTDQVRDAIMHAIRHEGTHCGHLGWLCRMHGVKTV